MTQLFQGQNATISQLAPGAGTVQLGVNWLLPAGTVAEVDVSAFLLGQNGKVLADDDFVFYNNPRSRDGTVELTRGDDGDKRALHVNLKALPTGVQRVNLTITADAGGAPLPIQSLSLLTVRLLAGKNEAARYEVSTREMKEAAITVVELYRYGNEWKIRAVGQGFAGGLGPLAQSFGVDIADAANPPEMPDIPGTVRAPDYEPTFLAPAPIPAKNAPVPYQPAPPSQTTSFDAQDVVPQPAPAGPDAWRQYVTDYQEPNTVKKVYEQLTQLLMTGETILYIAVQRAPVLNMSPEVVCLTVHRVFLFKQQPLRGMSFQDFKWTDLADMHLNEGMIRSSITFKPKAGIALEMRDMPKQQARRLYAISREREAFDREMQRQHELGVAANQQNAAQDRDAAKNDPVKAMQQLKELFDAGMISQSEYDTKRQAILERL